MLYRRFSCALLIALAGSLAPASAGVIAYGSSSDWAAAGTTDGVITFTGLSLGGVSSPVTVSPIVFAASPGSLAIGGTFGPGTGNYISSSGGLTLSPLSSTTFYGFAFSLKCYSCSGSPSPSFVVTDINGGSSTFTGTSTQTYWGVRSDIALASINVSYLGNYVAIDDLSYSGQLLSSGSGDPPPGDTPEAATLILIGTGLGLIARYRRYACLPTTA